MKLEISLFKFDKNSDYLPYYTKHFIKTKEEKTLLDILKNIDNEQKLSFVDCQDFDLVVNGVYVKAGIELKRLKEEFGTDIKIEPISIRRACDDLLINDDDFNERLELLKDFITEEDKKTYQELKPYFYASNTLNLDTSYIGDSLLILASIIMDRANEEEKNSILKIIDSYEVSASFYNSSKNLILDFDNSYEERIIKLQKALNVYEDIEKQNFRLNKTLILDFGSFEEEYEVNHDFSDFAIAYYASNNEKKYSKLINSLKAKKVALESQRLDLSKNTFNKNSKITLFTACTILLEAFDAGADLIVVDNDEDFYIFDYNRKELEKICGREVAIPVVHINELQKLVSGNHKEAKLTLEKHQVNPELI